MATRLHDIATLATLGMSGPLLCLYTLYQIPFILPIVISFAAFIGGLLIGRFLLRGEELIGLSSCRIPVRELVWPVVAVAFFLSLANFACVSELATTAHLKGRQLILDLQRTSPLALLKQPKLIDRGHFAAFSGKTNGGVSEDFVFVFFEPKQARLGLIRADSIGVEEGSIVAHNTLLLGTKGRDIWIENIGKTRAAGDLFAWLGSSQRRLSPDHLTLRHLSSAYKSASPKLRKSYENELGRRIAFGLAPFSLTILGLGFALHAEPRRKKVPFWPALLAILSLALIFVSKSLPGFAGWSLQIGPQLALLVVGIFALRRAERGRI
jgi:lipopolysaccharide export system permease protein